MTVVSVVNVAFWGGGPWGHWILILTFHRVPMELQVLGVPKAPVDQR